MFTLFLLGCVHRVQVTTIPAGAALYRNEARVGEAPVALKIPIFASTKVQARLPGYRSVTTSLRGVGTASFITDFLFLHWRKALGLRTKADVEIRLTPDHGPLGTWDPEQVP